MSQIFWSTTLSVAGESLALLGVTGAATQYITKLAMQSYNRICPTNWKMKDTTVEKVGNTTAAVVSSAAGIGLFAYKLFMQKYGRSDEMPAELLQKYKDQKFLGKVTQLFPHLMPYNN